MRRVDCFRQRGSCDAYGPNDYVESFRGRLRDECLNPSWFRHLFEPGANIETWRIDYSTKRPHSYQPPEQFAKAGSTAFRLIVPVGDFG